MVIIIRGSPDKLQPYKGSIQAHKYENIKYKIQNTNIQNTTNSSHTGVQIQNKLNTNKYKLKNIDGYNYPREAGLLQKGKREKIQKREKIWKIQNCQIQIWCHCAHWLHQLVWSWYLQIELVKVASPVNLLKIAKIGDNTLTLFPLSATPI